MGHIRRDVVASLGLTLAHNIFCDTDAMGITMLKMDHAKVKWRLKLQAAFQRSQHVQGECSPS